jgi:hypothetical protein
MGLWYHRESLYWISSGSFSSYEMYIVFKYLALIYPVICQISVQRLFNRSPIYLLLAYLSWAIRWWTLRTLTLMFLNEIILTYRRRDFLARGTFPWHTGSFFSAAGHLGGPGQLIASPEDIKSGGTESSTTTRRYDPPPITYMVSVDQNVRSLSSARTTTTTRNLLSASCHLTNISMMLEMCGRSWQRQSRYSRFCKSCCYS